MKRMKALLVTTAGVVAAGLLASFFASGGPAAVRAEHAQGFAAARPDTVLISGAALDGLDQRLSYLEGVVASLTVSSQHISTYQLCVSGEGGAETCLSRAQLDALLADQAHVHEKVAVGNPARAINAGSNDGWITEPESTGSIAPATVPAREE
jgi:hypothetical protein